MLDLEGMSVVVTGSASGIGRAAAEVYAAAGASVLLADLNLAGAEAAAAGIREAGADAHAVEVDVSSEASVKAMIARGSDGEGGLDILVNCAALTSPDFMGHDGALADLDVETWDRALDVDARGVMLGCKHAIPVMLRKGSGSIVNVSSGHSLVGELEHTAYGAAKAAVNSLTRYVATQYGKLGIRCNTVIPGPTFTPALLNNVSESDRRALLDNALTPHLGDPVDVARVIVFVSSPWARYMTGETICVTGGRTAHGGAFAQLWNERFGHAATAEGDPSAGA